MMKLPLPKTQYIWMAKIVILLGVFLVSIFVFRPNILNPVFLDNLAMEYAPDEWFQSPIQNYTFSPNIDIVGTNPLHEDVFTYSRGNTAIRFNTVSNTSDPFFTAGQLFEFQNDNILCGRGYEAYHFYQYDTLVKVKEIPRESFSSSWRYNISSHLSFVSPNFEFIGFDVYDDTFILFHQSSEGGPWSKVYESCSNNPDYKESCAFDINDNGTEIWITTGHYMEKSVWQGDKFLVEESHHIDTDPDENDACFLYFFSENNTLFSLKITNQYYRLINCSNLEAGYGNLTFLDWSPFSCSIALSAEGAINVIVSDKDFTSNFLLELEIFPDSSTGNITINDLPPGSVKMSPYSDYVFISRMVLAADGGYDALNMKDGAVYQYFTYCYQISTHSVFWWWTVDTTESRSREMLRIGDQMLVEYHFYSSSILSTKVLIFDIPAVGSGDPFFTTSFQNPIMNSWFVGINSWSLILFLCLRPRKKPKPTPKT